MSDVRPITPSECRKGTHIPDFIVEIVNRKIAERYTHGVATIEQGELLVAILDAIETMPVHVMQLEAVTSLTRQTIFDKGWLNFEPLYEAAGWTVTYDKRAYDEAYPATFTFRAAETPHE